MSLGKRIAERFTVDHSSLAHALLAGLPVNEVVTTNYDVLFEGASAAVGRPATVVPYGDCIELRQVALEAAWLHRMPR